MEQHRIRHFCDLVRALSSRAGTTDAAAFEDSVRRAFENDFGYLSVESIVAEAGGQHRLRMWVRRKLVEGVLRSEGG